MEYMNDHATNATIPPVDPDTITVRGDAMPSALDMPTMDVPTAGRYLGLSRALAYNAAASGELPTIRFGKRIRVPTAAVRRLLQLDANDAA